MQQVADIVLEAARRLAVDGIVSLAAIQADPGVQVHVNTPSRVIDLMGQLEGEQKVRMACRHPEPRWHVTGGEA
jgi:hypothetical protein